MYKEVKISASVSHPNVVRVVGIGTLLLRSNPPHAQQNGCLY